MNNEHAVIEQMFNEPSLRMLPNTIFFQLVNGAMVPTDQMGLLYTKEEIAEVVRVLTCYLEIFPDIQVGLSRKEFFMKYFPERFGLERAVIKKTRKPKKGFVYLISRSNGDYKIGYSKSPEARLKTFQCGMASSAKIEHLIPVDDMTEAEYELHNSYQYKALGGEWFRLTSDDVADIKKIVEYSNRRFVTGETDE